MKHIILFATLALAAQSAHAQLFTLNFTGSFLDGVYENFTIEGFVDIETNGLMRGTADTEILTSGAVFDDFSFEVYDLSDNFVTSFGLFDDSAPLAEFDTIAPSTSPSLVGLDFFGLNFEGEELDVFYDAFADSSATGISVFFDDGFGGTSNGTLDLPTAVPEPSSYAGLLGLAALASVIARRKRALL